MCCMSRRDTRLLLHNMLDYANYAVAFVHGKSRADLDTDRMLQLALTRALEITGEAASQLPREQQTLHIGIPWLQMISLRNRLIHSYASVDLDILWQIIVQDLPPLISELEAILASYDQQ